MHSGSIARVPLLVTVSDAARRLRRHEQTIRAMIRRGELAAVRLGRLVRVFASAVEGARGGRRRPSARPPGRPAATGSPRSARRPAPRTVRRPLVPSIGS